MLDPVELFPEVPNLYEFPSVHADMVFDERRVRSYQKAIHENVKEGDVVVDVGAGTGLLSFLCVQAGARRVHAIERTSVIEWAKQLAAKNGFVDRIVFHYADARDLNLDEKVDLVVSELMGHVAFEEGMAETISFAKDKFLKPTGSLIPQRVSLHGALVTERSIYPEYVDAWDEVWGIDYSFMREQAVNRAYVTEISERDLLSKSQTIVVWDFSHQVPASIEQKLVFSGLRKGAVNGVAFWFDAQLTPTIRLSSSPWSKTHWQQCFVPFHEPIAIHAGEEISVLIELKFRRTPRDRFVFNVRPCTSNSNGT